MGMYDYNPYKDYYTNDPYDPALEDKWYDKEVAAQYSRFDSATDRSLGTVARGLGAVTRDLGFDDTANYIDRYGTQKSVESERFVPDKYAPHSIKDIDSVSDAMEWAGNTITDNAPQLIATLGLGIAGGFFAGPMGAATAIALGSAPMHLGEAVERQEEEGVYDPSARYASAIANTALDFIPAAKLVGAFAKLGTGTIAKAVISNAAAEGATEVAQGVITDYQAGVKPDLSNPDYLWEKANEAAAGGLFGGILGGGARVVSGAPDVVDTAKKAPDQFKNIRDRFEQYRDDLAEGRDEAVQRVRDYGLFGESKAISIQGIRDSVASNKPMTREQQEWLVNNFTPKEQAIIIDSATEGRIEDVDIKIPPEVEAYATELAQGKPLTEEQWAGIDALSPEDKILLTDVVDQRKFAKYDEGMAPNEVSVSDPYEAVETQDLPTDEYVDLAGMYRERVNEEGGIDTPDVVERKPRKKAEYITPIKSITDKGEFKTDNVFTDPVRGAAVRMDNDEDAGAKFVEKLNTSSRSDYKLIPLDKALTSKFWERVRNKGGAPSLEQYLQQEAEDILASRTSNPFKSKKYAVMAKKNPAKFLNMFNAIERTGRIDEEIANKEVVDYDQLHNPSVPMDKRVIVNHRISDDVKLDTTKPENGYIPINRKHWKYEKGKAQSVNVPKMMKVMMTNMELDQNSRADRNQAAVAVAAQLQGMTKAKKGDVINPLAVKQGAKPQYAKESGLVTDELLYNTAAWIDWKYDGAGNKYKETTTLAELLGTTPGDSSLKIDTSIKAQTQKSANVIQRYRELMASKEGQQYKGLITRENKQYSPKEQELISRIGPRIKTMIKDIGRARNKKTEYREADFNKRWSNAPEDMKFDFREAAGFKELTPALKSLFVRVHKEYASFRDNQTQDNVEEQVFPFGSEVIEYIDKVEDIRDIEDAEKPRKFGIHDETGKPLTSEQEQAFGRSATGKQSVPVTKSGIPVNVRYRGQYVPHRKKVVKESARKLNLPEDKKFAKESAKRTTQEYVSSGLQGKTVQETLAKWEAVNNKIRNLITPEQVEKAATSVKESDLDKGAKNYLIGRLRNQYRRAVKGETAPGKPIINQKNIDSYKTVEEVNAASRLVQESNLPISTKKRIVSRLRIRYEQLTKAKDTGMSRSPTGTKAKAKPKDISGSERETKRKQFQDTVDKLLKGTGVKVRLMTEEEALANGTQRGIVTDKNDFVNGVIHGFVDGVPGKDGFTKMYINPRLAPELAAEIVAHETGHAIMYDSRLNMTDAETDAIAAEYEAWIKDITQDSTIADVVYSKKTEKAAEEYLKYIHGETPFANLDPQTQAYLKGFDEWFADRVSQVFTDKSRPKTEVGKFFYRIVQRLKKLFGGKDDAVRNFLDRVTQPESIAFDLDSIPLKPKHKKQVKEFFDKVNDSKQMKTIKDVILDKDSRLRAMKIPAMTELADLMFKDKGDTRADQSYSHAKYLQMGKYETRMNDILAGMSKAREKEVIAELYNPQVKAPRHRFGHTRRIRALFKDLADYMEKSGIEVNRRRDYFPEIVNLDYLLDNEVQFKDMMAKYPKEMESIAKSWTEDPKNPVDAKDVPQMLFDHLVHESGLNDSEVSIQQSPGVRFLNRRILDFMTGEDRVNWTTNFLEQDIRKATSVYIQQSVKKAEYEKRFGKLNDKEQLEYIDSVIGNRPLISQSEIDKVKEDAKRVSKLELLMEKARKQGATPEQIQRGFESVSADLGTHGKRSARWLNKNFGLEMPDERSPINPYLQNVFSTAMTAANVWVLGMSTITSLADPVGIAVRSGDMGLALQSFKDGMQAAMKSQTKSDLEYLGETIGAISDVATREALHQGYNSGYMSPMLRKVNDTYFKWIGLEAWTRTTRLMAVAAGQRFIKRHVKNPGKNSERFLKELGLQEGDVTFDNKGNIKVLGYESYSSASKDEQARDDRVRSALAEFVDTSILRPSPSQRPLWASDPHWALVFHLKSFMYSFQKTILNRVWYEAKQGNMLPMAQLAGYIPVMIAVGMIKDVVKTAGDDDDDFTPAFKENWDTFDYMWDAVQKGGLTGIAQPIFDIQRDWDYGGSGYGALVGPVLDPTDLPSLPVPLNYYL